MPRYPDAVPPLLSRLNRPIVAIVVVTALAGFVRFFHLAHPGEFVFDEVYYPKAGCILIGWSDETCRVDSGDEKYWREHQWDVGSWVHPPLGKWEIGLGIKAFGMDPFGWRVTSALAGTLVVFFSAILAQLLFRRPIWTLVAGTLLAFENLNVVMSRTALLDVHLELWVVIGFVCFLMDRRWIDRRQEAMPEREHEPEPHVPERLDPEPGSGPEHPEPAGLPAPPVEQAEPVVYSPVWRPWRFAAGAAFGAATSVKWSGFMALFAAVVLSYMWETARRHHGPTSWPKALWHAFARESFGLALAFVLVPLAVYMAVWLPWLHHFGWSLELWWKNQRGAFDYHRNGLPWTRLDPATGAFTPTHPYYSKPWTWIFLLRPVSFYVKDVGPDIQQILAIGNPAVFWAAVVAVSYLAYAWWRRRDWLAGFLLVAFVCQYAPWFAVGRPTFFFYVLPLTPFMVLAVTYGLVHMSDAKIVVRDRSTGDVATNPETGQPAISTYHPYRPFVWIYVAAVVLLFLWFWPVLTGGQISDVRWRLIVWFNTWI